MRKFIKMFFVLVLVLVININVLNVNASTNTYERSEDNLLVKDWITDVESKKNYILSTPAVDATEKIYDFAELFSDNEEKKLYNEVSDYISKHNIDLSIVTIDYNNKHNSESYADDFYDYNDFGKGNNRNGILVLIDMYNRQIYISTTGSAINNYTDKKIDYILDKVYKYLTDKEYYDGISETIDLLDIYYSKSLGIVQDTGKRVLYSFIGGLIITLIVMLILIRKNKLVRQATTARENLDKESAVVNNMGDVFIGSNTVKHHIDHSSSSGGSSTHSGSSGGSHGGGGHGF